MSEAPHTVKSYEEELKNLNANIIKMGSACEDSLGKAILKREVIGKLIKCEGLWCFIRIKNMRGYVLAEHIWGASREK